MTRKKYIEVDENTSTNVELVIGKSAKTRLIEFFIENDRDGWTYRELKEQGFGNNTLTKYLKFFERIGILYKTEYVYFLSPRSKIVKQFRKMMDICNKELWNVEIDDL